MSKALKTRFQNQASKQALEKNQIYSVTFFQVEDRILENLSTQKKKHLNGKQINHTKKERKKSGNK